MVGTNLVTCGGALSSGFVEVSEFCNSKPFLDLVILNYMNIHDLFL